MRKEYCKGCKTATFHDVEDIGSYGGHQIKKYTCILCDISFERNFRYRD
jgi:hypothetical protein